MKWKPHMIVAALIKNERTRDAVPWCCVQIDDYLAKSACPLSLLTSLD